MFDEHHSLQSAIPPLLKGCLNLVALYTGSTPMCIYAANHCIDHSAKLLAVSGLTETEETFLHTQGPRTFQL